MQTIPLSIFKKANKYVQSAAIDSDGDVWGYICRKDDLVIQKNILNGKEEFFGGACMLLATGYNADNWKNSAIERDDYAMQRIEDLTAFKNDIRIGDLNFQDTI